MEIYKHITYKEKIKMMTLTVVTLGIMSSILIAGLVNLAVEMLCDDTK